jgi:hypothetical protein
MQAMTGFHVVQGKPVMSAPLMAGLIKGSGKYEYRIRVHTDTACEIDFISVATGEVIGESSFTIEDAKKANLLSNNTWRQYPRNMLFARALSNGARWHTPDVFNGPVYVPEEMGLATSDDGTEIVHDAVVVQDPVVPRVATPKPDAASVAARLTPVRPVASAAPSSSGDTGLDTPAVEAQAVNNAALDYTTNSTPDPYLDAKPRLSTSTGSEDPALVALTDGLSLMLGALKPTDRKLLKDGAREAGVDWKPRAVVEAFGDAVLDADRLAAAIKARIDAGMMS